jgi:hypothetical protein
LEPPRRPSEGVPEQQDAAPHSEFRSSKQIEPEASFVGIGNQLGISLDFIFHVDLTLVEVTHYTPAHRRLHKHAKMKNRLRNGEKRAENTANNNNKQSRPEEIPIYLQLFANGAAS